jgi:hypothetical protein
LSWQTNPRERRTMLAGGIFSTTNIVAAFAKLSVKICVSCGMDSLARYAYIFIPLVVSDFLTRKHGNRILLNLFFKITNKTKTRFESRRDCNFSILMFKRLHRGSLSPSILFMNHEEFGKRIFIAFLQDTSCSSESIRTTLSRKPGRLYGSIVPNENMIITIGTNCFFGIIISNSNFKPSNNPPSYIGEAQVVANPNGFFREI